MMVRYSCSPHYARLRSPSQYGHQINHGRRGAMTSFKGGMQDRNVGPLLPGVRVCVCACACLTFNKKLKDTE